MLVFLESIVFSESNFPLFFLNDDKNEKRDIINNQQQHDFSQIFFTVLNSRVALFLSDIEFSTSYGIGLI